MKIMNRREAALVRLEEALRKKPQTARELAKATRASKSTVYARIERLEKRGFKIARVHIREGTSGPLSTQFHLVTA